MPSPRTVTVTVVESGVARSKAVEVSEMTSVRDVMPSTVRDDAGSEMVAEVRTAVGGRWAAVPMDARVVRALDATGAAEVRFQRSTPSALASWVYYGMFLLCFAAARARALVGFPTSGSAVNVGA